MRVKMIARMRAGAQAPSGSTYETGENHLSARVERTSQDL
jgi:hypothetical protein